jgi:hypothetical protein
MTGTSTSLVERMKGAARLDIATFEEVGRDPNATTQALAVVALAGLAEGLGALRGDGGTGLIGGIVSSIIAWALFSLVAYVIGTSLFRSSAAANPGSVMRMLGFAYTPQLLSVFRIIPLIGWIPAIVGTIWFLIAAVVALRQSMHLSTTEAIGVGIISTIAYGVIRFLLAIILHIALWGLTL